MNIKTRRTFSQLGYSHLDTAEIVTMLNRLLCNYAVYQQKLKQFHWNVTGPDFFELHNLFESMYSRANTEIDSIAERIRLFNKLPVSTFKNYLKQASIKEVDSELTAFQMAKFILEDIRSLLEIMEEAVRVAQDIDDNGTEHMLRVFIKNMEKEHWMLQSWIKQPI